MTITRFTPFRNPLNDVVLLQNRLNSIFSDFVAPGTSSNESLATGSFVPAVDIYEDAQKLVVKVEAPGIKQDDLDVRVENNTLTIKGERRFEAEEKEENFHRIERRYGSFQRSLRIPDTVDEKKIEARFDKGVLKVTLPKRAEAASEQRKIEIKKS